MFPRLSPPYCQSLLCTLGSLLSSQGSRFLYRPSRCRHTLPSNRGCSSGPASAGIVLRQVARRSPCRQTARSHTQSSDPAHRPAERRCRSQSPQACSTTSLRRHSGSSVQAESRATRHHTCRRTRMAYHHLVQNLLPSLRDRPHSGSKVQCLRSNPRTGPRSSAAGSSLRRPQSPLAKRGQTAQSDSSSPQAASEWSPPPASQSRLPEPAL